MSIYPTSGAQFQKELKTNQTHEDDAITLECWTQLHESQTTSGYLAKLRAGFVSAQLSENALFREIWQLPAAG